MPDGKNDAATELPVVSDGYALARQIAQTLSKTPGFILISGCEAGNCNNLLTSLENALQSNGSTIRLQLAASAGSLFEQLERQLGCNTTVASAVEFAAHFEDQPAFLLCCAAIAQDPRDLEQLRQLSNLQTASTHLGIVLCGGKHLEQLLPATLKQRITAAFRLTPPGKNWPRHMAWLGLSITLAAGSVLFYTYHPGFSHPHAKPTVSVSVDEPLAPSLKVGPVLAEPQEKLINDPRQRIFQSEEEAWDALRAYEANSKPSRE